MTAYISGGITGVPNYRESFMLAAKKYRKSGWKVINPVELDDKEKAPKTWADCLKRDIIELLKCDAIVMLRGWEKSKGAQLERHIAEQLGLIVITGE